MDPEADARFLSEYWTLVEKARQQPALSGARRAVMKQVNERLPHVNEILRSLGPGVSFISASTVAQHWDARDRVARAMNMLAGHQKMAECQRLTGESVLPLSTLDPVVYQAAAPLWEAGKYRQAVADAATNVNQFIQYRLGRHDVSDKDLMAQAFSDKDPEPGKPRLRCPGNHRSMTVRSMQQGALLMAQGCFQAIRNPAAHTTGDWNPVTAAEYLTVLSVVARWVRYWNVIVYQPPVPDFREISTVLQAQATNQTAKAAD
jgi:uncharacterized protein (TIGR02391 family)